RRAQIRSNEPIAVNTSVERPVCGDGNAGFDRRGVGSGLGSCSTAQLQNGRCHAGTSQGQVRLTSDEANKNFPRLALPAARMSETKTKKVRARACQAAA